jgi:hypothetical protein
VDEHDQVVSMIRSDVPDAAPIIGEVPFFLGINYLNAIKASLEGDVQLEVLNKQSLTELIRDFPEDYNTVCQNLWSQFDTGRRNSALSSEKKDDHDDHNLDKDKLLTKRRILESANLKKEQQFTALCVAAHSGDIDKITFLSRQGANLNQTDYDGRYPYLAHAHALARTHTKHIAYMHIDIHALNVLLHIVHKTYVAFMRTIVYTGLLCTLRAQTASIRLSNVC